MFDIEFIEEVWTAEGVEIPVIVAMLADGMVGFAVEHTSNTRRDRFDAFLVDSKPYDIPVATGVDKFTALFSIEEEFNRPS